MNKAVKIVGFAGGCINIFYAYGHTSTGWGILSLLLGSYMILDSLER
jgi:hypothetical protein